MSDTRDLQAHTEPPDVDDYWAPEPIENQAVAEWFGRQPESRPQPSEVYENSRDIPTALFGQAPCVPYGEWIDPIPAVYASSWSGGEIGLGDMRLSLDEAEAYAQRILAAVAYQRTQPDPFKAQEVAGDG